VFYASTNDYAAFSESAGRPPEYYRILDPLMVDVLRQTNPRILELGAGRTRFPDSLGESRNRVQFHAQDVTPQNRDYLQSIAEQVFIGDITSIPEDGYHLIFSTYVIEHVSSPREFLEQAAMRLAPGGWHVIICPRYDLPGYLAPSLRHLSRLPYVYLCGRVAVSRLGVISGGMPAFWINTDPAVFHGPWYTDADAVHLASRFDLVRWHRNRGFAVKDLRLPCGIGRDWIAKRLLTIAIAFQKPAA
jgi:SAM-dependent methyltransferase